MKRYCGVVLLLAGLVGCVSTGRPAKEGSNAALAKYQPRVCPGADTVLAGLKRGREALLPAKDGCIGDRLRYVGLQLLNTETRPDLSRLQQQLDLASGQLRVDPAEDWQGLLSLLQMQLLERRRHDEAVLRAAAQSSEQQRRIEELSAKLDALRLIEQSMADKASKRRVGP
ncbi:MAG: hypothetical protein JO338_12290 [Aquitalea sp.]|nr:hypothetical protein [Aquitalea sp.]